jgi:hypothetical protein
MSQIKFRNAREAMIYEIGHTAGMMKREHEIQSEIATDIWLQDRNYSSIMPKREERFRLHSDNWFNGMENNIHEAVALIERI